MNEPNFIIAGERRSGTTYLAAQLEQHPSIFVHPRNDMGYFIDARLVGNRTWFDGPVDQADWNLTHSREAYCELFDAANGFGSIGEKSADYFFWQPSHLRIRDWFPDIKLIVVLRNPSERAWSHYWNEVGKGRESLSFEQAIEEEPDRISKSDFARDHLSYFTRGCFDLSLQKLYDTFDSNQVHITTLESLRDRNSTALAEVFRFLEVDDTFYPTQSDRPVNQNWTTVRREWATGPIISSVDSMWVRLTNRIACHFVPGDQRKKRFRRVTQSVLRRPVSEINMAETTRQSLDVRYESHIASLEELIGRKLIEWGKRQ